jgi:hypothetical protein
MRKKIKVKIFDDLRKSLQDAVAFEQGRGVRLRVTEFPPRSPYEPSKFSTSAVPLSFSRS